MRPSARYLTGDSATFKLISAKHFVHNSLCQTPFYDTLIAYCDTDVGLYQRSCFLGNELRHQGSEQVIALGIDIFRGTARVTIVDRGATSPRLPPDDG